MGKEVLGVIKKGSLSLRTSYPLKDRNRDSALLAGGPRDLAKPTSTTHQPGRQTRQDRDQEPPMGLWDFGILDPRSGGCVLDTEPRAGQSKSRT